MAKATRREDQLMLELNQSGPAKAMAEALALAERKAKDYNQGPSARDAYFPLGIASYAQMLHVKTQRLISLAAIPRETVHESVRDTALDLINYASFLVDWLDRTKNQEPGDA